MGIGVPLLTVFLLLGSWAWGSILLRVIGRFVKADLRESFGPAIQICLGVSVFLFVGGWLIATNMAWGWILLGWHFLGILLESPSWISWIRGKLGTHKYLLVNTGQRLSMGAVYVLVTLCGLGITATQWWNGNDDWPSYVYLAQKVVDTGGMIDPLDFPRILSYGGMTLYQSIFIGNTGTLSVRAFDFVFCPIVIVAMLYEVFKGRRVSRVFLAVFSVLIIVGTGVGTIQNISPHYAVTMLDLAALLILWKSYETESVTVRLVGLSLTGLLIASLLALRPEYAIMPAVAWLGVMLLTREKRIKAWVLPPIIGVLALLGWAVALYRSSKTFMYPFMAGTATPGFGMSGKSWTLSRYFHTFINLLRINHQGLVIFMSVLVSLFILRTKVSKSYYSKLLLVIITGCIVQMLMSVYFMSGHILSDLARFQGPTIFSLGICVVTFLLIVDANSSANQKNISTRAISFSKLFDRRTHLLAVSIFAGTLCMYTPLQYGGPVLPAPLLSMNLKTTLLNSLNNLFDGTNTIIEPSKFIDPLNQSLNKYKIINKSIPSQSKVLAAVESPGLLDMRRFDLEMMGAIGASSVPKINETGNLKRYLKLNNVGYFIAQLPSYDQYPNSSRSLYAVDQEPLLGISKLTDVNGFSCKKIQDLFLCKIL